jgi:hypothetical protein
MLKQLRLIAYPVWVFPSMEQVVSDSIRYHQQCQKSIFISSQPATTEIAYTLLNVRLYPIVTVQPLEQAWEIRVPFLEKLNVWLVG